MTNLELHHYPRRPAWLDQEPALQRLLNEFLDKIEATQKLSLRVTPKTVPELYSASAKEAEYLWTLIKELDKEYHLLSVRAGQVKPLRPTFEQAHIVFVPEKEALVRTWLNRPRLDPYALLWDRYLDKLGGEFADGGETLRENIIRVAHKSPEHILRGFAQIGTELRSRMTLRSLSARCFWGDSKFLERREALVQALYPAASQLLEPRPLLLNCYIPETIERLLLVENLEPFLTLVDVRPTTTALIYSAGLRGNPARMRKPGQATFAQMTSCHNPAAFAEFRNWWFDDSGAEPWPVVFWGDLDFAACAIIQHLRQSLPGLSAWPAGYRPLLERVERGEGHGHRTCGKELQQDPQTTGCVYTDTVLLPMIRASGLFVDQEAVLGEELEGFR